MSVSCCCPISSQETGGPQPSERLTRRALLRGLATAAAGASVIRSRTNRAAAHSELEMLDGVELPPDIGQSELHVYIPQTGHTLRGTFLDYWRANGGAAIYGFPISEPFAAPNGYYSQAFERGVFQYHPEFLWPDEPIVRLMPIHDLLLDADRDLLRWDSRRSSGGGYRRSTAWRRVAPDARITARALQPTGCTSRVRDLRSGEPSLPGIRRMKDTFISASLSAR